jgi:large subunit ribosomal protein L22
MKQDFAKAIAYNVKVTPRKAKLVVDLVKGKTVNEALAILSNVNRKAVSDVVKVIKSAAANAVKNHQMTEAFLYVAELAANEGKRDKRFMPRGKGSASQIIKRKTHLFCVVKEKAGA